MNKYKLKRFFINIISSKKERKTKEKLWDEIELQNNVCTYLRQTYINSYLKNNIHHYEFKRKKDLNTDKIIWQYWEQGINSETPPIVKVCIDSVKLHKGEGYTHILLTKENISEYIELPQFVLDKLNNKTFTYTFFSDLLRVILLSTYGGVWLDATIFLTDNIKADILNKDFFAFQRAECPKDYKFWENYCWKYFNWNKDFRLNLLSSFMVAQKGNKIIGALKDLLLAYWEKENELHHYNVLHFFFDELVRNTDIYKNLNCDKVSDLPPHLLQTHFNHKFDKTKWNEWLAETSIHKLTYKYKNVYLNSVLEYILKTYGDYDITHKVEPAFEKNNIPIVFATDNNFVPYLGVTIKSLVENASKENNYDIVILYSKVDDYNRKRLQSLEQENVSIRFFDMTNFMESNKKNWYVHWSYSDSVYYRFFIPQIFQEYDKVLFLDADLVVNCDIKELYEKDLEGQFIGAVMDIPRQHKDDWHTDYINNTLMLDTKKYFNAGVILFDLNKIDKNSFLTDCIKVLKDLNQPPFQDQDVFNFIFKDKVKYLENMYNLSWNCIHDWKDCENKIPQPIYTHYINSFDNPKIIHYAGRYKPWKSPWLYYSEYFWNYARQTVFYEEIIYKNTRYSLDRNIIKNAIYRRRIYLQYLRCKFLKIFAFGSAKQHYKEKLQKLKNRINDYRKTLEK